MADSTTKLVFEGDVGKAVLGIVKLVEKMKEAKGEVKDFGKVSKETDILGETMNKAAASAKNFIQRIAMPAAILADFKMLINHMKEIVAMQSKMAGTTETVEQLGLKLAALRGDTSKAGVGRAITEATSRATMTGIPLALSTQIGLSAETIMGKGTPGALSAADTIAKFAGPMGLKETEVDNLARLFVLEGAKTSAQQEKIINTMMGAVSVSRIGAGEFIEPFVSARIAEKRKGFTLEQSLSGMVGAIESTGSAGQAASSREQLLNLLTEPKAAGFKFLKGAGRKEGVDFEGLAAPQRLEFGRQIYEQYAARGELDKLRLKLGARGGFEALEGQFGGAAVTKQAEAVAAMQQEIEYVNKLAAGYAELNTKRAAGAGARELGRGYAAGQNLEGQKILNEMAGGFMERTHAEEMGLFGRYVEYRIPDFIEKAFIKHEIIKGQMSAAAENVPEANRPGAMAIESSILINFFNTEFIERLAKVTNDFQLGVTDFKSTVKNMNNPSGPGQYIETD